MNGTERIRALLEGKPIDRTPVAGWYHTPLVDLNATDFFNATVMMQQYYHWDFIKVMTNGHFMPAAYGAKIDYSLDRTRWYGDILDYPVKDTDDLLALAVLDPYENITFSREIGVVKRLRAHYQGQIPIIATIFNPITSLQEMVSMLDPTIMRMWMHHHKHALHVGLKTLQRTIEIYLDALIESGIDGIFFANQYASKAVINSDQYDEFVKPYDDAILDYIAGRTWFNMAHVHGQADLWFEKYENSKLQAFNWENVPAGVPEEKRASIRQVHELFPNSVLITGIDQHHDFNNAANDREQVKATIKARYDDAVTQLGSNRFVFGPGCTLPLDVPEYLFTLIYEVAEQR